MMVIILSFIDLSTIKMSYYSGQPEYVVSSIESQIER